MKIRALLITVLSLVYAIGCLQPNHYWPWKGFQNDAWAGITLCLAVFLTVVCQKKTWHVEKTSLFLLFFALIPSIQLMAGQIVNPGEAWISSTYLLGFLMCVWAGSQWEVNTRWGPAEFVFTAALVGSLFSVGLQLWQWLRLGDLGEFGIWLMGEGDGRPFANLGQPNLLASLILWGILAAVWAYVRGAMGATVTAITISYLLIGLAFTFSRTAWLALCILVIATWWWRALWPNKHLPLWALGFLLYFAGVTLLLDPLSQMLQLPSPRSLSSAVNVTSDLRLAAWEAIIHGITQSPWIGYGWNQVVAATFNQTANEPLLHSYFSHSHNLILDLFTMMGIPLGALAAGYLIHLFWRLTRSIEDTQSALIWMALLVVGNHAMLEFPLHYAYFLLPTGLLVGALTVMTKQKRTLQITFSPLVLLAVCSIMLCLTIRDYFKVETLVAEMRAKEARIAIRDTADPSDVWLLSQWRDYVALSRYTVSGHESPQDLARMRGLAIAVPAPIVFVTYAKAQVLQNHNDEAIRWLNTMCSVSSIEVCQQVEKHWKYLATQTPDVVFPAWSAKNL